LSQSHGLLFRLEKIYLDNTNLKGALDQTPDLGSFLKIRRSSDFLENSQIITSLGDLEQAYIIDDYSAQKSSLHIVTTLGMLSL
jgi:hypothetical protein